MEAWEPGCSVGVSHMHTLQCNVQGIVEVVTTEHVEDGKVDLSSQLRELPVTEQLKQGGRRGAMKAVMITGKT